MAKNNRSNRDSANKRDSGGNRGSGNSQNRSGQGRNGSGRGGQAGRNRSRAGGAPKVRGGRGVKARGGRAAGAEKEKNWFTRLSGWQQTGIILGGTALGVVAHFLLWTGLMPVVGELVGRVPVLSTVVGWLFAGGAFAALGVLLINRDTAKPETVRRLKVVGYSWSAVAILCIPTGIANDVALPVDFWAGVFAGTYGVAISPLAAIVVVVLWTIAAKVLRVKDEPTNQTMGWMFVGYAALLLVWGSTLLRMP